MTPLLAAVCSHLASVSLQAGCLAALVYGLERLLGHWLRPGAATAMWWVVLLRLVLPADLGTPLLAMPLLATALPLGGLIDLRVGAGTSAPALHSVAIAVWLGVAALAFGIGGGRARRRSQHLRAVATPVPRAWSVDAADAAARLGLSRRCAVRCVPGGGSPFTAGILRPWIGIPVTALELPPPMRRHVLLHELAHVRRRDAAFAAAALSLQLLFWFHPAVWLAARRLRLWREVGADALAVAATGDRRAYCATLLRVADGAVAAPLLPMSGPARELAQRIRSMRARRRGRFVAAVNAALVAIVLCCAPMAAPPRPFFAGVDREALPGCLLRHYALLEAMATAAR